MEPPCKSVETIAAGLQLAGLHDPTVAILAVIDGIWDDGQLRLRHVAIRFSVDSGLLSKSCNVESSESR